MFEKEAEEYQTRKHHQRLYGNKPVVMKELNITYKDGFKDGYNKANEWHYVKDGDLPKDMENVFINAFDYGINTCYVAHRLNGKWKSNCSSEIFVHVIAWKEIVLPKECK